MQTMRHILLICALALGISAQAQVSTTFVLPDTSANNGETVCLPITTMDFTAGIEFSFALLVEPGGPLTFNRLQNFNPAVPDFGLDDFNTVDFLGEGVITVMWRNYRDDQECYEAPSVVTLADGATLFEVCYDVSGSITDFNPVSFYDKPDSVPRDGQDDSVPIIFNKRPQCDENFDAFPGIINGSVTIGVDPVIFGISEQTGVVQPGDVYCVDISVVSGYENLQGFQYGVLFDTTVLRAVSVQPNSELSPAAAYNIFDRGTAIYTSWNVPGNMSRSQDPGFTMVNVCFDVVGDCGDGSTISLGELPREGGTNRPIEATGPNEFVRIPLLSDPVDFMIANCNPSGFDVNIGCPSAPVNFGEEVCIDIQAGADFIDMVKMNYALNWNPDILQFTGITFVEPSLLINQGDDFITERTADGVLFFDWDALGSRVGNLNEGDVVYTLCFEVVGFGGVSPITAADFRNMNSSQSQGPYNGLNPSNCTVEVARPDGVALYLPSSSTFRSSEDACIELRADGLSNVTGLHLVYSYPLGTIVYRDFIPAVPGLTAMELPDGPIQLQYSGAPFTLADGEVLGSFCFRARVGTEEGTCAEDSIGLLPNIGITNEVITTASGGNSVPIENFKGEACVVSPNGIVVIVEDTEPALLSNFCVPVRVGDLVDVERAEMRFLFDPSLASFDRLNLTPAGAWPNLSISDFDLSDIGIGIITLRFDNGGVGVSHPGGDEDSQVFEICFDAGNQPECFELQVEPAAEDPVTNDEGDGSIVPTNGTICIQDRIIVNDITTVDASCGGAQDGEILYDVAPRADGQRVFIRTSNPVRFGRNGRVTGLYAGEQHYVLYTEDGSVQDTGTVFIDLDPLNAAVADAGPDLYFGCTGPQIRILESRNNVGEGYSLYRLESDGMETLLSTGIIQASGAATIIIEEVGTYIMQVTSDAGCTDRDTVGVDVAPPPIAEAGPDVSLTCEDDQVYIDGSQSSRGSTVRYLWQSVDEDGNIIDDNVSTNIGFTATTPGTYRLTVTFADLDCSSQDSVTVDRNVTLPSSQLPDSLSLSCDGSGVLVTTGPLDTNYFYSWYELELGPNFPIGSANSQFIDEAGVYIVELFNRVNECILIDTVIVNPSSGAAQVTFPSFLTLKCNPDTTLIDPLYLGVDENTIYRWYTPNGAIVTADVNQPAVRITESGDYSVIVENGACVDTFSIFVSPPLLPAADAGADRELNCDSGIELTGNGTGPGGTDIEFEWTRNGNPVAGGNNPQVTVTEPGTYLLTVTVEDTGCSSVDSVNITPPMGFPSFELPDTIGGLGCPPSSVELALTSLGANDYEFEWRAPDGMTLSNGPTATADSEGSYQVVVTNPTTGCSSTANVVVVTDPDLVPDIVLDIASNVLTCERSSILVDAGASSGGNMPSFQWETLQGNQDISLETGAQITITSPGSYRLRLVNPGTNCQTEQEFMITSNDEKPVLTPEPVTDLSCIVRTSTLSFRIGGGVMNYDVTWTDAGGQVLAQGQQSLDVTQAGEYTATVVNTISNCEETLLFTVMDLLDDLTTIVFAAPQDFDCLLDEVTLDASTTDLGGLPLTAVSWTALDGGTITPATGSLMPTVNGPGRYALTLDYGSGCEVTDTVSVGAATDTPFANAGDDIEIGCEDMPQLDGSASSPAPSATVIYAWTAADGGGQILSGADGTMPFVSGPGEYQLTVTNMANGCADTSRVSVLEAASVPAMIMLEDARVCTDTGRVVAIGNLPSGTSGTWTTFNADDATFLVSSPTMLTVGDVGSGLSVVWTLSLPGCADYSSDTIIIGASSEFMATNDTLRLPVSSNTVMGNLVSNDIVNGDYTIAMMDDPSIGDLMVLANGDVTYTGPTGVSDTVRVDYELCFLDCPDRCDTATVVIILEAEMVVRSDEYNAITPNGDGKNELFIFEEIARNPTAYPDRELTVFNRWGDIVYQSQPYNNDWDGTSDGGSPLPEGTYYYVLRLSIGEGKILRGDVTIIR